LIFLTPQSSSFDVVVVGSGPAGGIAAYALATAGLKVCLVEAGPQLRPGIDFGAHRVPGARSPSGFRFERDHFTPVGDRPAHGWLKALGGRSLCWAGHSLRFGPLDFRHWPIAYAEIAPYYSRVERFMGVSGHRDGLSNLPDGEYLKPVRLRCPEMRLSRGIARLTSWHPSLAIIGQRKAILTERHASRRPVCHYCGGCMRGCDVDAKYTSANTPIPLALKTGRLTLRTDATMTRILMAPSDRKVAGIEYTNSAGVVTPVWARAVVLACGAVETARQLLLNRPRAFPHGLANNSGEVGRNLTSHFGVTVVGYFADLKDRDASNDDGTDYYHSLITGLFWERPSRAFEGTYQIQCGAGVRPQLVVPSVPGFGASFKRSLREKNAGHVSMNMQGMLARSASNLVDLDPDRPDRNGLWRSRVHLHYGPNDVAMARDMVDLCEEIVRGSGGEVLSRPGDVSPSTLVIDSNHWVGTARMGRDPKTSVVNAFSQAHDVPNLFIGDAAVFPAYPEKNPTLTNMALAWRMSEYLVEQFRTSEL
jgi:choline dehydrogenase-like flavoprotein